MSFLAGVGWICVVLFEGSSPLKKNSSILMVFLGKKQLGSTSPWIAPRSVTHMKHLHTCLAKISSFVFTKRTKNFWRSFKNEGSQDPNNDNNVDIVTCWPYNIVIVVWISFFLPFNSWSSIFKGSLKKFEKVVPLSVGVAVSFSFGVNFAFDYICIILLQTKPGLWITVICSVC